MRFLKYVFAAVVFTSILGSGAQGAPAAPVQQYATISDVNCATVLGDNGCAAKPNVLINAVAVGTSSIRAYYSWSSNCAGGIIPDGVGYFRPTGATVGCYIPEPVASSSPAQMASVADVEALKAGCGTLAKSVWIPNVGHYAWNGTSTATADGVNVLQCTGVTTGRMIIDPGPLVITTIAALQALPSPPIGAVANVTAYYTGGPSQGGGQFTVMNGALCTSGGVGGDNGTKFCVSNGAGGYLTDRYWLRQLPANGKIAAEFFGCMDNDTADDTACWKSAIAYGEDPSTGVANRSVVLTYAGDALSKITDCLYYRGGVSYTLTIEGKDYWSPDNAGTGWDVQIPSSLGCPAGIIYWGSNRSLIRGMRIYTSPSFYGLPASFLSSSNPDSNTLAAAITGTGLQTITLTNADGNLTAGRLMSLGTVADFEIVTVVQRISSTQFTAVVQNTHATGEVVNGSPGSSGSGFDYLSGNGPSASRTTIASNVLSGTNVVIPVTNSTNFSAGQHVFVGDVTSAGGPFGYDVTYVTAVGVNTVTVASLAYNHNTGERVISLTAFFMYGNFSAGSTQQVSEVVADNLDMNGYGGSTYPFTAVLGVGDGNTKNASIYFPNIVGTDCGMYWYGNSGAINITRLQGGSNTIADLCGGGTATVNVNVFETEDIGARFVLGGFSAINVMGGNWNSSAPADDDVVALSRGNFSSIGVQWYNLRTGSSIPKIVDESAVYQPNITVNNAYGAITSINNYYQNADTYSDIFYSTPSNSCLYHDYPLNYGNVCNVTSLSDTGAQSLPPIMGQLFTNLGGVYLDNMSAGQTTNNVNSLNYGTTQVTIPYTAFQSGVATVNLESLGIAKYSRIVSVYANVTTPFTGTGGTLTMSVGRTSAATDLLSGFNPASTGVIGTASIDLGTCLSSPVQGGCTLSGMNPGNIYVNLTTSTGLLSALTAGQLVLSVTTEKVL